MQLGLLTVCAHGQASTPQTNPQRFDVVAIKPNISSSWSMGMSMRDGTLQVTNLYLTSIITSAYGVREGLISGLPGWAQSARFDITAKVLDADPTAFNGMSRAQRRAMIAALLTDRFNLKVHTALKTLPIYELVVAGSPKFKESVSHPAEHDQIIGSAIPSNVHVGNGEFTANGAALSTLSSFLAEHLDREVIDKTGLMGKYDLHLTFTPDDFVAVDSGDASPSIFTALREQLGLELRATKGPVQTLVVDRIDRPSAN